MDGEKSEIQTEEHVDLTLFDYYQNKKDSDLLLLYPELPSDYFEKNGDPFQKEKNPIQQAVDKYNDLPVKPYVRKNKQTNAYEIGIRFDF